MISAVVLTQNEERLEKCLKSLSWCDEIIVIDDNSGFKSKAGIKVFKRKLNNDFAAQRNFGLAKAKGEWVLFVDADEEVSGELEKEIKKETGKSKFNGFCLKRNDYFAGRWLKHGETARVRLLRLARKRTGEWKRKVHETWEIKGEIGLLKTPLLHYPHPTISEFTESINFHSSLHAEVLFEKGIKISLWQIIFFPVGKFFQNYLWRLGFLDGMAGLIVALMMSLHSFLARSKLYLKWKK